MLTLDPGELDGAPCRDLDDPEVMFPDPKDEDGIRAAKAVCAGCPVRHRCLEAALRRGEYGVWGGLTSEEREELRRKRPALAAARR